MICCTSWQKDFFYPYRAYSTVLDLHNFEKESSIATDNNAFLMHNLRQDEETHVPLVFFCSSFPSLLLVQFITLVRIA